MLLPLLSLFSRLALGAGVELPPGFVVERAATLSGSFLSITFDDQGRMFTGQEGGPILALTDVGKDGVFETSVTFSDDVHDAQGLVWVGDALYAVGSRGREMGVYRLTSDAAHARATQVDLVAAIEGNVEHGPHGIAIGPDGNLYVAIGDQAHLVEPPDASDPRSKGYEGWLTPVLEDPEGFGTRSRWPYGVIARIDRKSGKATYHSVGYRNHYDLAFDDDGELFTCDSDMEYDVGLPWYRPVRVLHAVPLVDFGARRGSSTWPADYEDTLPGVVDVGRGSPTGVCFGRGAHFPERYSTALYVGDWSQGRILAVHLAPKGASYAGQIEVFALGDGVGPITDLAVGPDGGLYWVGGGRGLMSRIQRIAYHAEVAAAGGTPRRTCVLARANVRDDAADKVQAALASSDPCAQRRACEELALTGADVAPNLERLLQLVVTNDRFVRYAAREALVRLPQGDLTRLVRRMLGDLEAQSAPDFRVICQCLFVFARTQPVGLEAKDVVRVPYAHSDPKHWGDPILLRAFEVCSLAIGEPDPRLLMPQQGAIQRVFPDADPLAARMQARLLAHWKAPSAIDGIAKALAKEPSMPQRIAWLDALRTIGGRWTPEQAARMFAAAESALISGGGTSYAGYIEAMREAVRARMEPRELADLGVGASRTSDPAFHLGARTLAWLASKLDAANAKPVVAEMRKLFDALPKDAAGIAERRAVLEALAGAASPEATAWLRELATGDAPEKASALLALTRSPREEDQALFVAGLAESSYGMPEACSRALLTLKRVPGEPETWSSVLDLAHRYGHPRGWVVLQVLRHWASEPAPSLAAADWNSTLQSAEQTFQKRFPKVARTPAADVGPRWTPERTLAFLKESSARKGSVARGAQVFARASCTSCHAVGDVVSAHPTLPGATGPDLAGISHRFDEAQILDAIVHPSSSISDQFRAMLVETKDDLRVEGRVRREDAKSIELALTDGTTRALARDEIASISASKVSSMPEGLLAPLSLEEIKDLFAFLRADGRADASETTAEDWTPVFKGRMRSGWDGDAKSWKLDHDLVVGRGKGLERSTYLVSKASYADFEATFDVRISQGGNSGFQYRSTIDASKPDPVGYQADAGQTYWGSLFATDGRGLVHAAERAEWKAHVDPEGWNHYRVLADGDHHVIEVNGHVLTDVRDGAFKDGVLALQLHEKLDMEVDFANVLVRRLR